MKTVLVGLDAFSPVVFERLHEQGRLPHLSKMAAAGDYAPFAVANPPQSEVSWTSIATGLDAAGHGIFDFVHRDPATYGLTVSLLPARSGLLGLQFVPPFTARTIFDEAVGDGFPATALWWPAVFPARPQSPVRTIPGLGTPDIHGRLGVGILFSNDPQRVPRVGKTRVVLLNSAGKDVYRAQLPGPMQGKGQAVQEMTLDLELQLKDNQSATCRLGRQVLELTLGQWSPVIELAFKSGWFFAVKVVTRLILTQIQGEVRLYCLPLQIHPLASPWHYATPRPFIQRLWRQFGPFLTLGWPQDTVGLEDGCISDEQFLALCQHIFTTREAIFLHLLDEYREGILAGVFDSLDRIQHMFWHSRPDVIEGWYERLDGLVGKVQQRLTTKGKGQPRLMVVSDHGFGPFEQKVHLNRWLKDEGFLAAATATSRDNFTSVNWADTQAYALGLNSLYLNQVGREGQGAVSPAAVPQLVADVRQKLLAWRGRDHQPVVQQVWTRTEAYTGPLADYGPDLLIGYTPGYRASAETGLGGWGAQPLEPNQDHWHGDHCFAPDAVPGVLFTPGLSQEFPRPTYRDIPALALGKSIPSGNVPPPPLSDEEQEVVTERLKELGYL
ncbi:MAG: alkaline phosphatase family protein [Chloroflexi bacterium]|nr:alkaline phosphatase family protein [Chloroflexota bacterium]